MGRLFRLVTKRVEADGIDNDGDGKIDYPDDSGCRRPTDNSEA